MIREIEASIQASRFDAAASALARLLAERTVTADGRRLLEVAYSEIGGKPDLGPLFEKWCGRKGAPAPAFILRGIFNLETGWRARGSDYGHKVSPEARAVFRERLALAKADLEKAHLMNPNDPNGAGKRVRVSIGLSETRATMDTWFGLALKADPASMVAHVAKLYFLFPQWHGSVEDAGSFADSCVRSSPPGSRVYTLKLNWLQDQASRAKDFKTFSLPPGVSGEVDRLFARWKTDFPRSPEARREEARWRERQGRKVVSVQLLTEAIALDPGDVEALRSRAWSYYGEKSYAESRSDVDRLLAEKADDVEGIFLRGLLAHYGGNRAYRDALVDYDRALAISPREKRYLAERGRVRGEMLEYEASLKDLAKAIEVDPDYARAYYYRGRILFVMGRKPQAEADFDRAAALDRSFRGAIKDFRSKYGR